MSYIYVDDKEIIDSVKIKHMKKYLKNHTIKEGKEQRRTGTVRGVRKGHSVIFIIIFII
ncbi:hypothetical protein Avbf_18231 [Armadillidium vulgare]|nr:hypothetical protein Avbf_18231 [Armadillidium vulgare]